MISVIIGPEHTFYQQSNGTITSDRLTYLNESIDRQITFSNAYHPVDYGFELHFYKPTVTTKVSEREMVFYVLKENQDIEQTYLVDVVDLLKEKYVDILSGRDWLISS